MRSQSHPHEIDVKTASDTSSVHGIIVVADILLYDCGIEASQSEKLPVYPRHSYSHHHDSIIHDCRT